MSIAKLDSYDYVVLDKSIRVFIDGPADPVLVDIFSDIENSKNYIYVEGRYYNYLNDYEIRSVGGLHWVDLTVLEIDNRMIGDDPIVEEERY